MKTLRLSSTNAFTGCAALRPGKKGYDAMADNLDASLIFDITAMVALAFSAGLIWRLIVAARAPRDEHHFD
jgi:hypothetical protein